MSFLKKYISSAPPAKIYSHPPDLGIGVVEHLEEAIQQLGQELQQVDVGHGVQHGHPRHEELARKCVARVHALAQQRHERRQFERRTLRHYVLRKERQSLFCTIVTIGILCLLHKII